MNESDPRTGVEEVLLEFISESREMLDEAEPKLIELGSTRIDQGRIDDETLSLIFRLFHSLKGGADYLQLNVIVEVTHRAETLLDLIRSGRCQMTTAHTGLLCRCCDLLRQVIDDVESTGTDSRYGAEGKELEQELNESVRAARAAFAPSDGSVPDVPDTPPARPVESRQCEQADERSEEMALSAVDLRNQFVQEADDTLKSIEDRLLSLEKHPEDLSALDETRRLMHSFKGNCGLMGYADMEHISHRIEEFFEAFEEGRVVPEPALVTCILNAVDILQQAVAEVSGSGRDSIASTEIILQLLDEILPSERTDSPPPRADRTAPSIEPTFTPNLPPSKPEVGEPRRPPVIEHASDSISPSSKPAPCENRRPTTAERAPESNSLDAGKVRRQDIRVDLTKLDALINLVGELVIAETLVTHNPDLEDHDFENFERAALHLNKITRDLQDVAMSVRMIPIAGVFRKMIRLVHDVSVKLGKRIDLHLVGEDTEVDKTVAELLSDPLVHIIRNAADHGIETPEERIAKGKPPNGRIDLEARHESGEVWVIIRDDGAGLNREKILAKARSCGLVPEGDSALGDEAVYNLVFSPGFSTANEVTDVSGRGVGMDVVKKNIEKLKGDIEIHSQPGVGTTFILRIPLTLAIIDGMLVRVGHTTYTIPILAIRESFQPAPEDITVLNDGQELVNIRGELLPVLRLHELHQRQPDHYELSEGLLVVIEAHGRAVSMFIDELIGQQQTVIKGLNPYIGDVRGVSGCSILGNGDVSLILDVTGLIELARTRGEEYSSAGIISFRGWKHCQRKSGSPQNDEVLEAQVHSEGSSS